VIRARESREIRVIRTARLADPRYRDHRGNRRAISPKAGAVARRALANRRVVVGG
jgi:hypothetical protein